MKNKQSYSNKEKLKSQKTIELLFDSGLSFSAFPLRLVYLEVSFPDSSLIKAGVSVSKRNFKKAVDRNTIKRLMRESYRQNKEAFFNNITTQYALMFLYIGSNKPKLNEVDAAMKKLLHQFSNSVIKN